MQNSDMLIEEKPKILTEILDAIEADNLSIFIGAGVSRTMGCWSWQKLAEKLIERCYERECIDYREKKILSAYDDYKKVITVCRKILTKDGLREEFYDVIKEGCRGDDEKKAESDIYRELIHIPALFITTNFDTLFHDHFNPGRIVYKKEQITAELSNEKISSEKLYHIHGCIEDEDTLVLTVQEYIEKYRSDLKEFLLRIFSDKVMLFVGYGMAEFELLDFLIGKYDTGLKKARFILLPYFKGYESQVNFDQHYYEDMGVTIIPYQYDKRGYDQLYDVLTHWNEQIDRALALTLSKAKEIDELVDGEW